MKRRQPDPEWRIAFDDNQCLKTIVDQLVGVDITRTTFAISQSESGDFFLKVNTCDVAMVSYITVSLRVQDASLPADGSDIIFCVDCKQLNLALGMIENHKQLHIEGCEANVYVRGFARDKAVHEAVMELPTYTDVDPCVPNPVKYDMKLEIDLERFKPILNCSAKIKAERIGITIHTQTMSGNLVKSETCFRLQGQELVYNEYFCHKLESESDGSSMKVVRATSDVFCGDEDGSDGTLDAPIDDQREADFAEIFPVDKIKHFLAPLRCKMIEARLKAGHPIMFEHFIRGQDDPQSYIRFMVASTMDE